LWSDEIGVRLSARAVWGSIAIDWRRWIAATVCSLKRTAAHQQLVLEYPHRRQSLISPCDPFTPFSELVGRCGLSHSRKADRMIV
jgi:hypothetical protein